LSLDVSFFENIVERFYGFELNPAGCFEDEVDESSPWILKHIELTRKRDPNWRLHTDDNELCQEILEDCLDTMSRRESSAWSVTMIGYCLFHGKYPSSSIVKVHDLVKSLSTTQVEDILTNEKSQSKDDNDLNKNFDDS
jgi:hypothetical protein